LKLVRKLANVALNVAKAETATASFVGKPQKTIQNGVTMAPPPTPAIVVRIFNMINTNIPPTSSPCEGPV